MENDYNLPEYVIDNLKTLCSWTELDNVPYLYGLNNMLFWKLFNWEKNASKEEITKFNTLFILIYNKMYSNHDLKEKDLLFSLFKQLLEEVGYVKGKKGFPDIEKEIKNNFNYYMQILNNLHPTSPSELIPFVEKFRKEYKNFIDSQGDDPLLLFYYFTGDFDYVIKDNTIYIKFTVENLSQIDYNDLRQLQNWEEIRDIIKNINYHHPFILYYVFKDKSSGKEIKIPNCYLTWGVTE